MMLERARSLMLGIMLGLLLSCGGGSDSAETPVPMQGALALTISGLPSGIAGQVRVTGPGNFSQAVTTSQTLGALAPGSYTVLGERVVSGALSYTPTPASQAIAVTAGSTGAATVSYSAAAPRLALREVASVPGAVFAAAPEGDSRLFIVERGGRIRGIRN